MEVTDGDNGWHVHLHVLLCFREQVSADLARAALGPRIFGRWSRALERKGFSASEEHGWDLRRAQLGDGDLADYFTKMAHEVTGGHRKEGRARGGRTPMQLLADAVETYEESALARWWEWEAASDGRRQLTWSTGRRDLRALAGLGREATDEEIAEEDREADVRLTDAGRSVGLALRLGSSLRPAGGRRGRRARSGGGMAPCPRLALV